jgi:hypothetical protein
LNTCLTTFSRILSPIFSIIAKVYFDWWCVQTVRFFHSCNQIYFLRIIKRSFNSWALLRDFLSTILVWSRVSPSFILAFNITALYSLINNRSRYLLLFTYRSARLLLFIKIIGCSSCGWGISSIALISVVWANRLIQTSLIKATCSTAIALARNDEEPE